MDADDRSDDELMMMMMIASKDAEFAQTDQPTISRVRWALEFEEILYDENVQKFSWLQVQWTVNQNISMSKLREFKKFDVVET